MLKEKGLSVNAEALYGCQVQLVAVAPHILSKLGMGSSQVMATYRLGGA